MSGNSPRYGSGTAPKSPGGGAPMLYGSTPTPDYLSVNNSQPSAGAFAFSQGDGDDGDDADGAKGSIAPGTGPLTLPAVRNDLALGSAASFSGRGLHLGKTWRERCSWKCTSIALIILCAILTALVAYFAEFAGDAYAGK
ncbi:Teneurin-a [Portunus trituberculatus]|uniref:Teneurin-a n=1 Tax=Portunus trituberculatus TaxID=210409 RepID=A0A5B7FPA7_PORTR|nr:Teneurin-a [Portunus trituberculatus]